MNKSVIRKRTFLGLSAIAVAFVTILFALLWWLISYRLYQVNHFLANSVLIVANLLIGLLFIGFLLISISVILNKNFVFSYNLISIAIHTLLPITYFIGKILNISKEKIRESFILVNNTFVLANNQKYKPDKVLILLPHCLQTTECSLRITVDIKNCQQCGKCDISDITKLGEKYGVDIFVATGGTIARRIIIEKVPQFIIAVACHRDLVEGIRDIFPLETYGLLNERPQGPCINTVVNTDKLEKILKKKVKL